MEQINFSGTLLAFEQSNDGLKTGAAAGLTFGVLEQAETRRMATAASHFFAQEFLDALCIHKIFPVFEGMIFPSPLVFRAFFPGQTFQRELDGVRRFMKFPFQSQVLAHGASADTDYPCALGL
ncbi:MAG: hypothetical protein LBL72_05175 [Candidatus Accumulibacter sp.]|nr:hypothetical protein [Accumulibacter sp.]